MSEQKGNPKAKPIIQAIEYIMEELKSEQPSVGLYMAINKLQEAQIWVSQMD